MSWLERLRSLEEKSNLLEDGTAKTAKSLFAVFAVRHPRNMKFRRAAPERLAEPPLPIRTTRPAARTAARASARAR
jgi:hypothetical protein